MNEKYSNNIGSIKYSLYDIDSIDISIARNQILSLLAYKFLSENSENNNKDIGYDLDEEYYYKNLLINKENIIETLKEGIRQITKNNKNIQAADVFYDLFDLLDFDILSKDENCLSFIDIIDKFSRKNSISDISNILINNILKGLNYDNFKPSEEMIQIFTLNQKIVKNLYDPITDNGTLLVEIGKKINVENYYGQHPNKEKCIIAKMNLLMNNVNYKNIFIKVNDIEDPTPWNIKFDLCVSIPPFGMRKKLTNKEDIRFKSHIPKRSSEFLYILDIIYNLDENGTSFIVVSDSILRSRPDKKVIEYLVNNGFIKNIIGLPGGLFDATSIPTAILEVNKQPKNEEIFYLNLRKTATTRLPGRTIKIKDMTRPIKILINKEEVELISKDVELNRIIENEYNLSINRYIDPKKMEIINAKKTIENILNLKKELNDIDKKIKNEMENLLFENE